MRQLAKNKDRDCRKKHKIDTARCPQGRWSDIYTSTLVLYGREDTSTKENGEEPLLGLLQQVQILHISVIPSIQASILQKSQTNIGALSRGQQTHGHKWSIDIICFLSDFNKVPPQSEWPHNKMTDEMSCGYMWSEIHDWKKFTIIISLIKLIYLSWPYPQLLWGVRSWVLGRS